MPFISSSSDPRLLHFMDKDGFSAWIKTAPLRLKNWAAGHNFDAADGTVLILPDEDGTPMAAIIGTAASVDAEGLYANGALAARLPAGDYVVDGTLEPLVGLGFALDQYRFDKFVQGSSSGRKPRLVVGGDDLRNRLIAITEGVCLARDLINRPANDLTPEALEDEARRLGQKHSASIEVTAGDALAKRFPAIHVVGRAAEIAPRLIDMSWSNQKTNQDNRQAPLVTLVGKGITFDSGGLDLKPSSAMEVMKKDMGGAAHVLGLAHSIMALGLNIRLRVLIAAAENAVSALSMRPLDVIDTAAGIAVEVGNTDAEGRLVLADALHFATAVDDDDLPALLIDFATLTGAARVALGTELPALFCNDDGLAHDFITAGKRTGDPLWSLPLHDPYDRYLDAGHAALSSTGTSRYGGAITAALFLRRFLKKPVAWAHIDVMAWNLGHRLGHPKGGEAMGLRATLELIETRLKTHEINNRGQG
jgi:leucyl aminopeptidase